MIQIIYDISVHPHMYWHHEISSVRTGEYLGETENVDV